MPAASRLAVLLLLGACTMSRSIRPLGKGNAAASLSAGGPMVDYLGGTKPLPIAAVGVSVGVHDRVDVHGGAHLTTPLLFGLAGVDAGAGVLLVTPDGPRPAVMADLTLNAFAGNAGGGEPPGGLRVFPETDLRASWALGQRGHLIYTGPSAFLQFARPVSFGSWALGSQLRFGRWDLQAESRWVAPFRDNAIGTAEWWGPAGQGALSVHVGARLRFGPSAAGSQP